MCRLSDYRVLVCWIIQQLHGCIAPNRTTAYTQYVHTHKTGTTAAAPSKHSHMHLRLHPTVAVRAMHAVHSLQHRDCFCCRRRIGSPAPRTAYSAGTTTTGHACPATTSKCQHLCCQRSCQQGKAWSGWSDKESTARLGCKTLPATLVALASQPNPQ